ncbi:hypothetical protein NDU88_004782 [Pleurodeles waltl]|uniref:Uncharacterized protein n=1 Tax=Pleurodeles waltl TaxID=8319 RepID=A0AAV7RJ32_PLEWA|nr:hypothetical protein NDU88_004782 [Pleurodeles waltl]
MSAQPVSIVQKQQSNMIEICNEDQEKENTFDYGLDTSFKPDEDSKNFELHSETRGNKLETEPTTSVEGADFQDIRASGVRPRPEGMHDRQRTLSLAATWIPVSLGWCNVENILLRKRTTSRNMAVTIYRVPSRTNNVPHKSPTGILHANESIDLPYGLAAQNDGMINPCEENEDKDTPGCFNLGNCFRNMRKYFQKKYTRF